MSRNLVIGLAITTVVLGLTVLVGWAFDLEFLKRFASGPTMKANTAVGFIGAGMCLGALVGGTRPRGRRLTVLACGTAVALLGVATLAQDLLGLRLGIDELLFEAEPAFAGAPGRMAPATALGFALTGAALLCFQGGGRLLLLGAQSLAAVVFGIALLELISYAYGAAVLFYGLAMYSSVALHTMAGLALISVAMLAVHPRMGITGVFTDPSLGGAVIRKLLPAAAILVFFAGLVLARGQRMGFYPYGFGHAAVVFLCIALLAAIAVWYGRVIGRTEAEREQAREEVRKAIESRAEELEQCVAQRTSELAEREAQVTELAYQLSDAEQTERERVAHLLHEHLQQLLVAGKMSLEQYVSRGDKAVGERVRQLLAQAIEDTRTLAVDLHPPVLESEGLAGALRWLADYLEELELHVDADDRAEPNSSQTRSFVFQAARELLLNVVKHAQTDTAWVRLRRCGGYVTVTVEDAGAGCDPEQLDALGGAHHFGLRTIRQRLELLGGWVELASERGKGCRITLAVPAREL